MVQDAYSAYGSLTPGATTGAEVKTLGCESVAYQVKTAGSSPQVKAYGANPAGTFIPVRYRLITVAGVESLVDPDTASGVLQAGDRIIVPNNGYDQIRISTTAGTMTADATRNYFGGVVYELQKLIDGGISATVTQPDAIVGPGDPVIDSYTKAAINLTTGANQVLASSAANKQIWVYGFGISVGDADGQTISFQDEDDAALSGIMEFAQYGGMVANPSGNFAMPLWKLGTDKDLEVDITGGDADGWICYAVVSVA